MRLRAVRDLSRWPAGTGVEPVARSAVRNDDRRLTGLVDFPPEVADVHVDDVRARVELVVPDCVEDLAAAHHLITMAHEIRQQGELARGQLDLPLAAVRRP